MFVYTTRQNRNIFRSFRLQTRKRMWMFGPANRICLPGNGWKESSSVTELAQMAGRRPTHCPLTGVNKGPFSLEKSLSQLHPCHGWAPAKSRLRSDWRHFLGCYHGCLICRAKCVTWDHSGDRAVVPLESKDKEMAASTLSPVP